MKIFIIGGKARSGKTTLKNFLKEELKDKKVLELMFAKYIKDYAKNYFNWDGKEETKPRELLQTLGTDIIRVKLNKPFFMINRVIEDIEILSIFFDIAIIDDARTIEEIESIKNKFENVTSIKLIREVENNLTETEKKHHTEIGLDNYNNFDYIFKNNKSLEDLKNFAKEII